VTRLVAIVEGHGELQAVPILLRRLAEILVPDRYVEVPTPIRVKRDRLIGSPAELERAVAILPGTWRICCVFDNGSDLTNG